MKEGLISFLRQKDYILEKYIGQGGLGKTALLKDPTIDEYFVCKKYEPIFSEQKTEYYENFKNEIKLMHRLFHPNIVRIFNYYLYPKNTTGYILMEYIEGTNIGDYLKLAPEEINSIFSQIVEAFAYLEENNILHRDIRPQNIMVTNNGIVKVIDFGFGKEINTKKDFSKSISINWWCNPPNDFNDGIYDFTTEIYFIGKLIEELINEYSISVFKYTSLLEEMTEKEHDNRIQSFSLVREKLLNETFSFDDLFDYFDKKTYKEYMDEVIKIFSEVNGDVTFISNVDILIAGLEEIYKMNLLEDKIQNNVELARLFIKGTYKYYPQASVSVDKMKDFIKLLKSCSQEKKNIIMLNIGNRLKTIKKAKELLFTDDVPF